MEKESFPNTKVCIIIVIAMIMVFMGISNAQAYDDGEDYYGCIIDNEWCIKNVIVHDC